MKLNRMTDQWASDILLDICIGPSSRLYEPAFTAKRDRFSSVLFFYNLEHQDCYWQMTRSRVWSHVTKRYVSPSASLMVLRFLRCSKSPLVWYILPSHFLQDQNHSQSCLNEIAHRPKYMRVYSDWITTWLRNNYWNVLHLWHSSWK